MKRYWTEVVDRAAKSAAQGAIVGIGVESAQVNALAIDYRLCAGMAAGMALLSVLTNVGERGLFGRQG